MTGAVAIFVKTPGLSPVKTRLAGSMGGEWARAWHERAARVTAEVARTALQELGVRIFWAVAEPGGLEDRRWQDLPRIVQAGKDLGERMGTIHARLTREHGWCLLLGADAPQLDGAQLARAAGWLGQQRPAQVLGPARDGGFWTYGANTVPPAGAWRQVVYSRSDTAARFKSAMADCGNWLELDTLTDLDQCEDIDTVIGDFGRLEQPLASQKVLCDWLNQTRPAVSEPGKRTRA